MGNIEYRIFEKGSFSDAVILDFLKRNDDAMTPQVSELLSLVDYSEKIAEKAINFTAFKNEKLIGLFSLYFNRIPKFSYCTYVCVCQEYRAQHIGDALMNRAISYCIEHGSLIMRLSVRKDNLSAIKYYKKNKFHVVDENSSSDLDKISLLMEIKLDNDQLN